MRKKLVVLATVLCLALSVGLLAACNKPPEAPEGGSWTAWSENKIYTKNLKLVFEDEETFKVYYDNDDWITGEYAFADKPGTSTLTLSNAGTALVGVAENAAKDYEPTDGVYTIQFDHGAGGKSDFKFQPPQDGTKSGEEPAAPICEEFVDEDNDGLCDDCEHPAPEATAPAGAQVMVTMVAADEVTEVSADFKLYDNNTFVLMMVGFGSTTGTWAYKDIPIEENAVPDPEEGILAVFAAEYAILGFDNIDIDIDGSTYVASWSYSYFNGTSFTELEFVFTNLITMLTLTATAEENEYVTATLDLLTANMENGTFIIDIAGTTGGEGTWALAPGSQTEMILTFSAPTYPFDPITVTAVLGAESISYSCTFETGGQNAMTFNFTGTMAYPAM